MRSMLRGAAMAALLAVAVVPDAAAQPYPQARPIRLLVPGAAGGPTDVLARLIGDGLGGLIGQRMVVENRAAAGGVLAGETVARADPDGYTLLYANSSTQAINPALYTNMSYDPAVALVPIVQISNAPMVLVVNPAVPAQSLKELLAHAAVQKGGLNFSSGGTGTLPHLVYELFRVTTGINTVHVPYNGGAPSLAATISGETLATFEVVSILRARIAGNQVRALAITLPQRVPELPEVPTMAELGYAEVKASSWTGLVAPARTAPEILQMLNARTNELLRQPDFLAKVTALGVVPKGGSQQDFVAWIAEERERWTRVVKLSGATPQQ